MINIDLADCTSLIEFYKRITQGQISAHGTDYCRVHQAIEYALQPGDKRYVELGVNQGATLAAAMTIQGGLRSCHAYDINLENFEPHRHLFERRADKNNLLFEVKERSSHDRGIVRECDVLYIDTVHKWTHVSVELQNWSGSVAETIIIHDTNSRQDIRQGIDSWVKRAPWHVKEHNTQSVGYTILERT